MTFFFPPLVYKSPTAKLLRIMTSCIAGRHHTVKKYVFAMKLTAFFLFAFLVQVAANTKAQKVTITVKDAPLEVILQIISKQTDFKYIAKKDLLRQANKVSLDVKEASIKEALDICFIDQPLSYSLDGNIIIVKSATQEFSSGSPFLNVPPITGIVRGPDNQPISGANVVVKATKRGTITNADGFFSIEADKGEILIISSIGYAAKQLTIKESDIGTISLIIADSKLDEVQIIAYGTTNKRFSTSNISTVSGDIISKQPVSNPQLTLSGLVPGLFIQQTSGSTSSLVNVTIQGPNSLRSGTAPFYVIDGVPYSPQFTSSTLMGAAIRGQGGSAFNFINPADIESITVLKDADATAIYGSRAANGAILITTKKGKAGKTQFNVNVQHGWGKVTKTLDMLNTEEYLTMRKEAYSNAGQPVPTNTSNPTTSNYDLTIWDQNKYTDWQTKMIGGTAKFTNLQASVSGGNANTQFVAGYGYISETTVFPGNLSDNKGNVHFNVTHNSSNNKFKIGFSGNYLEDKNRLYFSDLMVRAITLAPNAPDMYNVDGSINWSPVPGRTTVSYTTNPAIFIEQPFYGKTRNLIANSNISYEILRGLHIRSNMGFNRLSSDEQSLTPITVSRPDLTRIRSARYLTKSIESWIIEPQITYEKKTSIGYFDALLGSTFQQNETNVISQTGTGYATDAQLKDIGAASVVTISPPTYAQYIYNAIFGRLNYRLQEKYVINLTARRDGSSRFGDNNKLHTFYSAGGAWILSEEQIFKEKLVFINFAKIRINYGTTGNDQIGDYRYFSFLSPYTELGIPYQNAGSLYHTAIANPELQWEETHKFNLGIDLAFFNSRLSLMVNYFRNRSSNQLLSFSIPSVSGFSLIAQNFPATIQNKGLEIQIDGKILSKRSFNWFSSFNITIPKNKLVSFNGIENTIYKNDYIVGQSTSTGRAFQYSGVNPTTGLYEFINAEGESTSAPNSLTDRTVLIDFSPKYYGGLSNTLNYKNLELFFLFQFVQQRATCYRFGNAPGTFNSNQPTYFLNRWKKPGDITDIQRVSLDGATNTALAAAAASDVASGNTFFARLKNVSLSYTLPENILKKTHIAQTRFYAQAQNLLTFTNYKGIDPETQTPSRIPPLRMLTLGLQITFN
jgi:TonB-dependent starch-binding outer membrane protein SusC